MGTQIIVGKTGRRQVAVFYCSTTGWAFGPVMESEAQALAFEKWLEGHPKPSSKYGKFFAGEHTTDPRMMADHTLEAAYTEFVLEVAECKNCGEYHVDTQCASATVR